MQRFSLIMGCGLPLALGALTGCGEGGGSAGAAAVHDSAGVRIVENGGPRWNDGKAWTVGAEPSIEIGTVDGAAEYQLSRVRGAVRLGDGRIVIALGDVKELRYYDASGRYLTTSGRAGGGPGEFKGLDAVHPYRGDSVVAWDPDSRRVSVFGADGRFGRAATLGGNEALSMYLRGVLGDGSLVLEPTRTLQEMVMLREGEQRDTVTYLHYTADGRFADTLGARADREQVTSRAGNLTTQPSVLFGRDSYIAAGGGRVFVGESDTFRIDALASDGAPVMSIRRPGPLRPVRREQLARVRAAEEEQRRRVNSQIAAVTNGAMPARTEGEVPARETIPAFDRLIVDVAGNLWVRDYLVAPDDVSRWSVFDPEGRWLGMVETPAGLDVHQIGSDWILGTVKDELDVEYVRLYPLVKR